MVGATSSKRLLGKSYEKQSAAGTAVGQNDCENRVSRNYSSFAVA